MSLFDRVLLSKQNHRPIFGTLLALLFIISTFVSFHPQDGASTLFEGGGEGESTSGGNTEGSTSTTPEICDNLVDDDGDGLIDNQDAIDCPATPGQVPPPTPTPTPELEDEEAPEEEEEEATPSPDAALTPTAEICDNTFDDDGDG